MSKRAKIFAVCGCLIVSLVAFAFREHLHDQQQLARSAHPNKGATIEYKAASGLSDLTAWGSLAGALLVFLGKLGASLDEGKAKSVINVASNWSAILMLSRQRNASKSKAQRAGYAATIRAMNDETLAGLIPVDPAVDGDAS